MTMKLQTFLFLLLIHCALISLSSGRCNFHGKSFEDGEMWNSTCNICQCHSKSISCTKIACPLVDCSSNEISSHHDNCCPPCNSFKKACSDEEESHVHNDVWFTTSDCILNQCQDGTTVSYVIQCPSVVCPKGEKLSTVPDECCPKCISDCIMDETGNLPDGCITHPSNISRECMSTRGLTENLAVVNKDSCTLCIYDGIVEKCFIQKCPLCSITSNQYHNHSCCTCPQSTCAIECESCLSSDRNHCLVCAELDKVLYDGKCVDTCPPVYFSDENNECKVCSPSCKTCFGNMTSQCTSCPKAYLLQKGRCVKNCDANYYTSGGFCLECHESCLSCHGPNSGDCISCPLPGQLLQDGNCVDNCTGHYYVSDGYCLECNVSCARCLKDGTCQYCEHDFFLEEGYCESECTPGYYVFLDAYCLPCHDECQSCFGPLPFHCTSCPFGQFLLENSCVWDCGQGYFGDLGAGICRTCHEDCRACLGGSSKDKCLTCSNGYLLPYIGTHFGSCVEKCPDGYFLTADGMCEVCHSSCEACFRANDTDCTSCSGSLFFKDGRCVPHCSNGYFQENGICYACHPSCATCYGFNDDECYTCHTGRTFKFDKCIPTCGVGKYMDLDNTCNDCDPSCQDCTLNSTEVDGMQCLQCKYQHRSIMYGQCNVGCPPNFYLNSNRICLECHPTCATCERNGATSCVTCWNGNFLTHLGTCEAHCHQGYFPANGVCQACDSNCHHCISSSECLQCKGDLVLQFGECIHQCSDQHYVDGVSRQCTECSWECNTCRGPSSDDCTSCIIGKLFQDGSCVQNCSEGFFLKQGVCEPCDLKCKSCSSVNKCTSCDLPLLLRNGECVDDCGSGQYADYETLHCKSCTSGCAYCLDPDECGLCFDGFYFMENTCLQSCPENHYMDPYTRVCKRNVGAPSLYITSNLNIRVGSYILITTALLNVSDPESDKLFVLVSDMPQSSLLVKMSERGDEIVMGSGDNFTTSQLEDGWIFFKHSPGLSREGNLTLKISDGQLLSDEINLPLQITSKFAPRISQIGYIVIPEESLITINSSFIFLEDKDNIEDVSLNIIQSSCNGKLVTMPGEEEVSTVTYAQFSQNQLAYKSSKIDAVYEDSFVIQAFDGFNSVMTDVKVIILPKNKHGIVIVHNKPFYVKNDAAVTLTNDVLLSVGEKIYPSGILYKIDQSRYPSGKLLKNRNDLSGNTKIKEDNIIFSQQDIDDGLIYLNHFNSNSSKVIKIKVSDKKSNFESEFDFEIHPVISEYDSPMQAIQFGMMVLQNHAATITNDHLLVQVNGISSNDIVYMITKKLLKEEGFLENLNKPGVRLQSFTQNDIDNLKIVYHPPSYGAASEKQFMFQFVVIDARSGSQLSPVQNFTITLTPPTTDFTSPASSIDHESHILLTQGGSVELGYHWLSTAGHQMPDDQLEVVLTNAPHHGILVQRIGGLTTVLAEDDGFSFSSIIQDMFYDHDGSNNLHDSAIFSIMGGRHSTLNRVIFEMTPNDRESPVILDSTTLMGSVVEGKVLTLQRHHLAFTDLISGDADIVFTLLFTPKYGILEKLHDGNYTLLKPNDQFTQQDINENLIRYSANIGIGEEREREFLYFDVADASGNVQSKQVLTVNVRPRIKQPPILKVINDIQVNEGGEAIIQPHILTVSDPDSPLSDLVVVIDKQPDYGFIENSRPIPGAENTLAGIPISSFPYVDLVEGYIKYMQAGHQGFEPDKDTAYIHILDGRLSSASHLVNITIRPMNDETPHVFTDVLSVLSRGYIELSNSSLSIVDADTKPDQLIITLNAPPQHGIIRKLKQSSKNFKNSKTIHSQDSFSFQDVLDGLVLYMHENFKSSQNDTFSLIVSDGQHTAYASVDVNVIQSDREVPFLLRNLGLELTPGNSSIIDNSTLRASDSDSPDDLLVYTLTTYPTVGQLLILYNGQFQVLPSQVRNFNLHTFTQKDINLRRVKYHHTLGEAIGVQYFKFNVNDPANNTLLDQTFFITISEDIFPPIITRNSGLKVSEKGRGCINSDMLAAVDEYKKSLDLVVTITAAPTLGYLELNNKKEAPISNFLISDVEEGKVCYVHSSLSSLPLDSFTFTITDGRNSVLQTFYINITSKYDGIPAVKISPLILKEGYKKIITEFEIDIFDKNTQDKDILIHVIKPPAHGMIKDQNGSLIEVFSVHDIKQNQIYYWHDDSESTNDNFTMTVSDGSNLKQILLIKDSNNITTENSIEFPIRIIQVDDVSPVLIKNNGLTSLRIDRSRIWNAILNETLLAMDLDTLEENIVFRITLLPRLGFLQLSTKQGEKIFYFTQKDINEGKVQYILNGDNFISTEDKFMFSVEDSNRNKITNNIFKIEWTRFTFNSSYYNTSESQELLKIPVVRSGYTHSFIDVSCDVLALSSPNKGKDVIIPLINQVSFGGMEVSKECIFKLNDNTEFQGRKQFKVILNAPTLYGLYRETIVDVFDEEDEPVISFTQAVFKVNETGKYFHFPVVRKGDKRQELSLMCETNSITAQGNSQHGLESGSDFISRFYNYNSFITFPAGSTEIWCSVEIIDDNLLEEEESFQLKLSNPHPVGILRGNTTAIVTINGPNDVPQVSFKRQPPQIYYGQNNTHITVIREGVDLSKNCTVMCGLGSPNVAERNITAFHEIKFIAFETIVEYQLFFTPFESSSSVDESVLIFLESPIGCVLNEPNIISVPLKRKRIKPSVEFSLSHLTVKEDSVLISIPIKRTGDLSQNSSIYCITHDDTAVSRKDFEERYVTRKTSLITFSPEQKESACVVKIYDDDIHESIERFKMELVPYKKDADTLIGKNRIIIIEIVDPEDATIIQLEKAEFIVDQQIFPNNISTSVVVPIMRYGDIKLTSKIRVSTIDGSASSGLDYYGKSKLLTFFSGERRKNFEIEILYNKRRNWALSFTVILGPDEVLNANIGNLSKAVVRIASVQSTESLILPAVPIAQNLPLAVAVETDVPIFIIRDACRNVCHIGAPALYDKPTFDKIKVKLNIFECLLLKMSELCHPGLVSGAVLHGRQTVVSLLHFDNITKGMMENPKYGYPLICVTPCDENYPDYAATGSLCKDSTMNSSSMRYSWEIAMPLGKEKISSFEMVTYSTLFTSAHHKVLDSIYFRPQERIRCVVQPKDSKGFLGIPLRSKAVKISSEIGFCHSTIQTPYSPLSLQSQPFIASLEYLNSSDSQHPNKLHIHIEIPHEDGLLPLISTYPLHNIEFLLTQNIYRQQHMCSNIQISSTKPEKKKNFLKSLHPNSSDVDNAFPHFGDQCGKEVHLLYQHLDLKKCKWSFDAWYTMTELVELCGGSVTSDFKTRDTDQTYLTVLLPLYVTYVFAAAPTGWTSVEHRTEMEFSFFYDTFLWKSGSHFDNSINATLAVVRVGTNPDGHMFFEFKTVAKFYGCFVLDHHTLPDMKSYVSPPVNIDVQFDLELLWSEQTFDGPMQFWRATSNYNLKRQVFNPVSRFDEIRVSSAHQVMNNLAIDEISRHQYSDNSFWTRSRSAPFPSNDEDLDGRYISSMKDYSGHYTLYLLPCKITTSEQLSVFNGQKYLPCIAQMPEKFELPLAFQQTNRPLPVTYTLETFFQLFNDENIFLMNPFENSPTFQYVEYKGAFSRGDNIYGRVFWSPKQGLESAYKLNINEIILCAGKNGYVPTYDPTGLTYGKGSQYGCLLPNKNLKYKFILLDKHHPDAVTLDIQGIPFNAKFVDDLPEFSSLSGIPGVDGFIFSIDPLYQISSSQQWFLQIIYHIKPTQKSRLKRSADEFQQSSTAEQNGSNIKIIFIEQSKSDRPVPIAIPITEDSQDYHFYFGMHHLLYIISALLIILSIYIIRSKSNFKKMLTLSKTSKNSYMFTGLFDALSLRSTEYNQVCEIQCKQKLKQKETYRIKVHTPRNDLKRVEQSSSETEV